MYSIFQKNQHNNNNYYLKEFLNKNQFNKFNELFFNYKEEEGDDIKPLNSPKEFYEKLKINILSAKNIIYLSALYIGSNEIELIDLIRKSLIKSTGLKVYILLDYLRSTRQKFPDRITVNLYHTPNLNHLSKLILPTRFNEGIGTNSSGIITSNDDNSFPDPIYNKKSFRNKSYLLINNFINKWVKKTNNYYSSMSSSSSDMLSSYDTIISPIIQMNQLNINQDEIITNKLLNIIINNNINVNNNDKLYLSTGYFNISKNYKEIIINHNNNNSLLINLITSSPEANGFFHSKGFSKYLPKSYLFLEKCFIDEINKFNKNNLIKMYEYKRENWTFHAKGLWYYFNNNKYPSLTLIGSSNYGYRSIKRDLELQNILITSNKNLQNLLHKELKNINKFTQQVTNETFKSKDRKIPLLVKIATKSIKT
ncbi:5794_t:CDS:2, partial [Entrophospora sp. SA101]